MRKKARLIFLGAIIMFVILCCSQLWKPQSPVHADEDTFTPTITDTPTETYTPTITDTLTPSYTPTYTETYTPTSTDTFTPTYTPTSTFTFTPTYTETHTPTITNALTATWEAKYQHYKDIAEEAYPSTTLIAILCGVIFLVGAVGISYWVHSRRSK